MALTPVQTLITIAAVAAGAMVSRFLPFMLFPENREVPDGVGYLGRVLPPAMMGLLVVYCFKGVSPFAYPYGAPEIIAAALIVALQLKWRNVLLSIGGGTLLYMVLIRTVFA